MTNAYICWMLGELLPERGIVIGLDLLNGEERMLADLLETRITPEFPKGLRPGT